MQSDRSGFFGSIHPSSCIYTSPFSAAPPGIHTLVGPVRVIVIAHLIHRGTMATQPRAGQDVPLFRAKRNHFRGAPPRRKYPAYGNSGTSFVTRADPAAAPTCLVHGPYRPTRWRSAPHPLAHRRAVSPARAARGRAHDRPSAPRCRCSCPRGWSTWRCRSVCTRASSCSPSRLCFR